MKLIKNISLFITSLFITKPVFAGEFDNLIGKVDPPKMAEELNSEAGGIGILLFFSKAMQFLTVIAGIWVILNVVLAAFTYITGGGKADNHAKVRDRLTMSFMGLLIITISYTVAGLIGLFFFGDATFIINPTIDTI